MKIEVLGAGCARCKKVEEQIRKTVAKLGVPAEVVHVNDFIALFPEDTRVSQARDNIIELRTEQARGSFIVAKFYEKYRRYQSALIYYNEVLIKDPDSPYAPYARERMEVLKNRIAEREAAKQKEAE